MMSFKELVEQDNKTVFMNLDEFADTHVIGGKEMPYHFGACHMKFNIAAVRREDPLA